MAGDRFSINRAPVWRRFLLSLLMAAVLGAGPATPASAEPATEAPEKPAPSVKDAQAALDAAKLRAVEDLDDPALLRPVALAYLRLGEALKAEGDLFEALTQLQGGLRIAENIAQKTPHDSAAQLVLSQFYAKIGDLQLEMGVPVAALRSYRNRFAIAGRLARNDPSQLDAQRNLAASYNDIGDVHAAQGDHAKALTHYQHGLVITNQISHADPMNTSIKAELDESVEKVRQTVQRLDERKPGGRPADSADIVPGGGDGYLPSRPVPSKPAAPKPAATSPVAKPSAPASTPTLPEFPWPPPRASATYVLPRSLLAGYRTIGDFTDALLSALETNGYVERSFYRTRQDGVALVTRLERINENGTPMAEATRWPAHEDSDISLYDLLRGLFYVDPGRYRVIVFVLQIPPFMQSPETVTPDEARDWLSGGANILPPSVAALTIAAAECTALIYEFASDGARVRAVSSGLTGKGHLDKAGLIAALDNAP